MQKGCKLASRILVAVYIADAGKPSVKGSEDPPVNSLVKPPGRIRLCSILPG